MESRKFQERFNFFEVILVTILSLSYIGLILSGFILQNESYNDIIGLMGWILWFFGIFLAFVPNVVFKKRSGVKKGDSYTQTTKLVDDGVYSIIRHPQYTGGLIIAVSMCLILQTWLTYLLAAIAITTTYISMILEEINLKQKFGQNYENYVNKTPRMNILIGIYRKFHK